MRVPDPQTAALGPRFHLLLARQNARAFRDALVDADWTCHACGIRVPEWMEVDHLDGDHGSQRPGNLGCICPWCHRARHPAARPEALTFGWLPELEPAHLSRLAATMVMIESAGRQALADAARDGETDHDSLAGSLAARAWDIPIAHIDDELAKRRRMAVQVVGTGDVAALVESAWRHPEAQGALDSLRWIPKRAVTILTPAGDVPVTERIGAALLRAMGDRTDVESLAARIWDRLGARSDEPPAEEG